MLKEVLPQSPFATYEKIPTKMFVAASGVSSAVAREIADLMAHKQQRKEKVVLDLATGSTRKKFKTNSFSDGSIQAMEI